jgi:hypothetical protein
MKKLLTLLFSLFLLSSPSVFADDISDFEIEGISIGDSLLDYMTEDEILEEIELNKNDYLHLNEPHKYVEIYLWDIPFQDYDVVSAFVKDHSSKYITKNKKFTILSIYGSIYQNKGFASCIQKRDKVVGELSNIILNTQKTSEFFDHPADPSGNSMMDAIVFRFDSGDEFRVDCTDLDETFRIKLNIEDALNISINSEEVIDWMRDY